MPEGEESPGKSARMTRRGFLGFLGKLGLGAGAAAISGCDDKTSPPSLEQVKERVEAPKPSVFATEPLAEKTKTFGDLTLRMENERAALRAGIEAKIPSGWQLVEIFPVRGKDRPTETERYGDPRESRLRSLPVTDNEETVVGTFGRNEDMTPSPFLEARFKVVTMNAAGDKFCFIAVDSSTLGSVVKAKGLAISFKDEKYNTRGKSYFFVCEEEVGKVRYLSPIPQN